MVYKKREITTLDKIVYFVKYNNGFVFIIGFIFFGFSVTMAASPDARQSIYNSSQNITDVDNSYILNVDLESFKFNLQIKNIEEDIDFFHIYYSYGTISVVDYVWKPTHIERRFLVSKASLGKGDLGLYLAEQLGQEIDYQHTYLTKVKEMETNKGQTKKTSVTKYSGLIGAILNTEQKVFPDYVPVKKVEIDDIELSTTTIIEKTTPASNSPDNTAQSDRNTTKESQVVIIEQRIDKELIRKAVEEILAEKNMITNTSSSNILSLPEPVRTNPQPAQIIEEKIILPILEVTEATITPVVEVVSEQVNQITLTPPAVVSDPVQN